MVAASDLAGFWAGTIVRGSITTPVYMNVSVHDDEITGSYEMPTAPSEYRTGKFIGHLSGELLKVGLPGHVHPGRAELEFRVIETEGEYMIFGHTALGEGAPKIATVTAYRVRTLYPKLGGIWL